MLKVGYIFLSLCLSNSVISQNTQVSVSTDLSVQRSLKKGQQYWAFGQNVIVDLHINNKNSPYFSVCYYSAGTFNNELIANAKSPSTTPQQINFKNKAEVTLKQVSMGFKHYLYGVNNNEAGWNIYGFAGLGLIFGKATNTYSVSIDTSLYTTPERPVNGLGHFKRLTLDLGLGWETNLGAEVYFYTEAKTWIPTTEYPSKYLFINNNAPFAAMLSFGIRILL